MRFADPLRLTRETPLFEIGLLLPGEVQSASVRVQLARWVKEAKLQCLRRGLHLLAEPYRATTPHPFQIANMLVQPSYTGLQAALAHYGLIPKHVPQPTSVTVRRPARYVMPLVRSSSSTSASVLGLSVGLSSARGVGLKGVAQKGSAESISFDTLQRRANLSAGIASADFQASRLTTLADHKPAHGPSQGAAW